MDRLLKRRHEKRHSEQRIPGQAEFLNRILAVLIFKVDSYVLYRSGMTLIG